jgi:hypothetical protein
LNGICSGEFFAASQLARHARPQLAGAPDNRASATKRPDRAIAALACVRAGAEALAPPGMRQEASRRRRQVGRRRTRRCSTASADSARTSERGERSGATSSQRDAQPALEPFAPDRRLLGLPWCGENAHAADPQFAHAWVGSEVGQQAGRRMLTGRCGALNAASRPPGIGSPHRRMRRMIPPDVCSHAIRLADARR